MGKEAMDKEAMELAKTMVALEVQKAVMMIF